MSDTTLTTPAVLVDAAHPLRLLSCPACAVVFALPESLFIQRASATQEIVCPSGHAHVYPDPTKAGSAERVDLAATQTMLLSEVMTLRLRVKRAEARLAAAAPAGGAGGDGPPDEKELKRRERLLAHTARVGIDRVSRFEKTTLDPRGVVLCPFCAKPSKHPRALIRHIRREHRAELDKPVPVGN